MRFDRVAFSARRRRAQADLIATLTPVVQRGLDRKKDGSDLWWRPVIDAAKPLFDGIVRDDGGDPGKAAGAWALTSLDLANVLTKTKSIDEHSAEVIATMVAGYLLSAATIAAARQDGEPFELEWVSMHDTKVRHTHRVADGQRVKPSDKFVVGGVEMRFPQDTRAPIKEWINCRCTVAAVPLHNNQPASGHTEPRPTQGVTQMSKTLAAEPNTGPADVIPWYGMLAPEGVWSGDRRQFRADSLTHRDLPLPLTRQPSQEPGHDGSVTVASIDWIDRRGAQMWGGGRMLQNEDADTAVGEMAHFGRFGVSVDADKAESSMAMEDGAAFDMESEDEPYGEIYDMARICSASMVGIPAFQEAFVCLGTDPEHEYVTQPTMAEAAVEGVTFSAGPGGGIVLTTNSGNSHTFTVGTTKASIEETDPPEGAMCLHPGCDETPTMAVSTDDPEWFGLFCTEHAAEHEDQPLSSKTVGFGRGPGWLTNPVDTKRIHDYWTVPGEPGYEKIGWGTDGDFNRCRLEVGSEIGEDSPEKLRFLNQICAQWHKDATGFWPGHAPAETSITYPERTGTMAPALALVASNSVRPPAAWFRVEEPDHIVPVQITEDGQIYGHLADWNTCHMNFAQPGECINPPHSQCDNAYFMHGEVLTDEGPIATGPLTLGTGHASLTMRMRPALAHYDNTGTAVADVTVKDGVYGPWISGWVRPWISEEKVHELRAASLSGDWRRDPNTGNHELVAALAVNSPGYPVRRVGYSGGAQVALVASLGHQATSTVEGADEVRDFARQVAEQLNQIQKQEVADKEAFDQVAETFVLADDEALGALELEDA